MEECRPMGDTKKEQLRQKRFSVLVKHEKRGEDNQEDSMLFVMSRYGYGYDIHTRIQPYKGYAGVSTLPI